MSKRANAFQHRNTVSFAGQSPIKAEKTYNTSTRSTSTYVQFSTFESFRPGILILADVSRLKLEECWANQIGPKLQEFFEGSIKPWLDENGITKFKVHYLMNEKKNPPDTPAMILTGNAGYSCYAGLGLTFKRQSHRVLFKLVFG